MAIDFNDINSIQKNGFLVFKSINELIDDISLIPEKRGVYFILYTNKTNPEFVTVGTGGHFKGRNPNVPINTLKENWVSNTSVIYIGKAGSITGSATLKSRLKQYFRFGQGKPVGHWGGRLIWQIKNSENLILCWKTLKNEEPRTIESELIQQFVSKYGKRPFANLTG